MSKKLKSGYTTGTHATAVFGGVLYDFLYKKTLSKITVNLDDILSAEIVIQKQKQLCYSSIKVDNDDLDVTKGCQIKAQLFLEAPTNLKPQTPSKIAINNSVCFIYGGDGVGIVTKDGLKIKPTYPAINPTPLKMFQQIANKLITTNKHNRFHIVISVEDGEEIAKQTANAKVGVLGGISILGTKGVVKPISADAYLDSIEAEISVAEANSDMVVFTLGNTAFDYAKERYDESSIIEIGNFIYESIARLDNRSFSKLIFITSVAKMCKIAQKSKNTHNRFGGIDFDEVKSWIKEEFALDLKDNEYLTLKALLKELLVDEQDRFKSFLSARAKESFMEWIDHFEIDIKTLKIITL